MKAVLILIVFLLFAHGQAEAVPDCYTEAEIPAHEFPFVQAEKLREISALSADGKSCVKIQFINGEPVVRQKIYVPFRKLYESYARAVNEGNAHAARKLFAYVRPTPRPFPLWAWLYDEPESAPMPWGTEMMAKIIRILSPDRSLDEFLISKDANGLPVARLERAWPALFLLMGGELLPSEEWASAKSSGRDLPHIYSWRFPYLTMESIQQGDKSYKLRAR